jgi:hypothetical protein
LAKVLATRGRNADAATYLQQAVTIDPDWAFWGRRETAFAGLFLDRPDLQEALDRLSMVPIVDRIDAAVRGQA